MYTKYSKTFNFGKIDYHENNRKTCAVEVEVTLSLRECNNTSHNYYEFTASANVWNNIHTDIYIGGQCLDTINRYYRNQLCDIPLWDEIYNLWESYHLNDMHAGTPEQEKAIEEWKSQGNSYDYKEVCEYLKSIDLYEVKFTGWSSSHHYENELYKYGHAWLIQELPDEVVERIQTLLN